jgi:hypothetical protein
MSGSVVVTAAPSEQQGYERTDTEGDANGLIRMFTYDVVGSFGPFHRFVADTARDFLGAIQRGGKTFAGFPDFFSGHVGGGGQQGARIFGQLTHIITNCLCMFVHVFLSFLFVCVLPCEIFHAARLFSPKLHISLCVLFSLVESLLFLGAAQ